MSRFKLPSGQIVQFDTPFEIEQTIKVPEVVEFLIDDDGKETINVIQKESEYKDVIQHPSGIRGLSPEDMKAMGIVELMDDVRPDDRYGFVTERNGDPGKWDYTPYPVDMLKERLISYAKDKRWQFEQGGFDFNGMKVTTDDRSQSKIMGARIGADADSKFTTPWAVDDEVMNLNAASVIALSDAAMAHVKTAFVIFASVLTDINGGKIKTFEAIDKKFTK